RYHIHLSTYESVFESSGPSGEGCYRSIRSSGVVFVHLRLIDLIRIPIRLIPVEAKIELSDCSPEIPLELEEPTFELLINSLRSLTRGLLYHGHIQIVGS